MGANWLTGNLLAFDTETTGPDPKTARIVSAACIELGDAGVVNRYNWLINPGVPIPAEATAIHGITDAMAAGGLAPLEAVASIIGVLIEAWGRGLPVVIMCAPYDLTLLKEEAERIAHDGFEIGPVIDPLVIDRGCDKYRKGSRKLDALAQHYKVKQDGAHSADGDALCAARIVWKQSRHYADLAPLSLADMQGWQAVMHREWAEGFQAHLRKKDPAAVVNPAWPGYGDGAGDG